MEPVSPIELSVGLLEDSDELREEMLFGLTQFGFDAWGASSAPELYRLLGERPCHIVVVDIGLPGEDGFSVAARLRAASSIGIVMLTARGHLEDRVRGLQGGADAYLVKPVDLRELSATLQGLARRLRLSSGVAPLPRAESPQFDWHLNAEEGALVAPGGTAQLRLTHSEQVFISCMLQQTGKVVSREVLAQALDPGSHFEYDLHRIDMLVSRLRRKAEASGMSLPLRAIRGRGYVFSRDMMEIGT